MHSLNQSGMKLTKLTNAIQDILIKRGGSIKLSSGVIIDVMSRDDQDRWMIMVTKGGYSLEGIIVTRQYRVGKIVELLEERWRWKGYYPLFLLKYIQESEKDFYCYNCFEVIGNGHDCDNCEFCGTSN